MSVFLRGGPYVKSICSHLTSPPSQGSQAASEFWQISLDPVGLGLFWQARSGHWSWELLDLPTHQRWEGLQTGRQRQRNNLLHHAGYCWITVYAFSVPADHMMCGNRVPLFLVLTLCIYAHACWNYSFCDRSSFLPTQGKYFRVVAQ